MTLRSALVLALLLEFAVPFASSAEMKAYAMGSHSSAPSGIPQEDLVTRNPGLTPTVTSVTGVWGRFLLEDDAAGTVTATDLEFGRDFANTINVSFMMAPLGAYVHFRESKSARTTAGASGSGSTTPGAQIDWGVVSGWSSTGISHCRSTPPLVCTFTGVPEDGTIAIPFLGSTTYDLGTWVFDSSANFEASPYITRSFPAGGFGGSLANISVFLRGRFTGSSIPALPAAGVGALAIGLGVLAGRRLRRGRER